MVQLPQKQRGQAVSDFGYDDKTRGAMRQKDLSDMEAEQKHQGWPLWKALLVGLGLAAMVRLVILIGSRLWGA